MNFNPFYEWWKRQLCIVVALPNRDATNSNSNGLAWIVITIINVVYGVIDCFKNRKENMDEGN